MAYVLIIYFKLKILILMANTHSLFKDFNSDLSLTSSKKDSLIKSREVLRAKISKYFKENHSNYNPKFFMQGSYKMNTTIRTKDDTCDIDDGVYFDKNPDEVTCTTLQQWVKNAVDGTTDDIKHCKKCITVNYKANYNIDLPVYLFDSADDDHPFLAVKNEDWRLDDPKDMVSYFNDKKDSGGQLLRIVKYLKAWCDFKREKMPSGLAMTILAMNQIEYNERDDISLKYTLINIENELKSKFECEVPVVPNDNLFEDYSDVRRKNFMDNLSAFISDARKAVDENNQLRASKLWKKHLGDRFPDGKDEDEGSDNVKALTSIVADSRPYYGKK